LAFKNAYKLAWTERANLEPNILITLFNGAKSLISPFVSAVDKEAYLHNFTFITFAFIFIIIMFIVGKFIKFGDLIFYLEPFCF